MKLSIPLINCMENTFGKNIIPDNDLERLSALDRYRIMDSPSEESFDNIARLATQIFNVPISLVSLVDADRVFFKANIGMGKAKQADRGKSLCALAVLDADVTIFEDALKEPCLIANPNVTGSFGLRFYAGAPLITHDGFLIGTLCIIDQQPRVFTEKEKVILTGLARAVMDQIELRLSALNELDKQQTVNDELTEQREEVQSINEELRQSQENLNLYNEHLEKSEQRFRNMIMQAPVAMGTLKGRELIVDQVNEMVLNIWGKGPEVVGLPLSAALPELEGQPFLQILDDVFTSGKAFYGYETKATLQHNGKLTDCFLNFVYQPITGQNGQVKDIMFVANDVTEQVDARKKLADINQRLEIALDAGSLGSTEVDLATGNMTSNEQFKKNYGYTKEEVFTYPDLFNTMLPAYRDQVKKLVAHSIATNTVYSAEYEVQWPDGSIHWIGAHGRPRYDENGKANRMVGMTKEITDVKLHEQRRDDFLGIASHELKTPITSLKASLQLLNAIKHKPSTPMHIKLIEQANRSMDKMSVLIDDLLNVNRMTEGQLRLNKTTLSVKDLLSGCCSHVRMAEKHELIFQGDESLEINADEHRIDQVIVNLVNNAVKYAPDSKEIILMADKDGDHIRIAVRDYGPGIAKDKLPHLFQRYYRGDHSGTNYTGLGLGLYICSEIVQRHGGQIGIDSELGNGCTFWFTLPL